MSPAEIAASLTYQQREGLLDAIACKGRLETGHHVLEAKRAGLLQRRWVYAIPRAGYTGSREWIWEPTNRGHVVAAELEK